MGGIANSEKVKQPSDQNIRVELCARPMSSKPIALDKNPSAATSGSGMFQREYDFMQMVSKTKAEPRTTEEMEFQLLYWLVDQFNGSILT